MVAPQAHLFSINTLATMTGLQRQTITNRLAKIAPSGMRNDHPVYHLSVAVPALWKGEVQAVPNAPQMTPADKKHLVQAQREAVKLKTETGHLLDVAAVRRERAKTTLQVINMLNALPEIIGRVARLSPPDQGIGCSHRRTAGRAASTDYPWPMKLHYTQPDNWKLKSRSCGDPHSITAIN